MPVLGYDTDASRNRLVVNEAEAEQVREIFALFGGGGRIRGFGPRILHEGRDPDSAGVVRDCGLGPEGFRLGGRSFHDLATVVSELQVAPDRARPSRERGGGSVRLGVPPLPVSEL